MHSNFCNASHTNCHFLNWVSLFLVNNFLNISLVEDHILSEVIFCKKKVKQFLKDINY